MTWQQKYQERRCYVKSNKNVSQNMGKMLYFTTGSNNDWYDHPQSFLFWLIKTQNVSTNTFSVYEKFILSTKTVKKCCVSHFFCQFKHNIMFWQPFFDYVNSLFVELVQKCLCQRFFQVDLDIKRLRQHYLRWSRQNVSISTQQNVVLDIMCPIERVMGTKVIAVQM